ncbi:30S ribosomal protein S17e [Candidatus Woesearchaeota archaeon]|nr:30S ribosomal protein S17e [Candidatus Pacearchaeota archaeon]MBI4452086.1 30S ribosomal protein S17e [Candidatus Woesearchaeota archaeon]
MGRIKTKLVKGIAHRLVKVHSDEFTSEFEKNKGLVEKYTTVASAKMRNTIAGYTARLVKQRIIHEKEPKRRMHEEDFSKFYQ